jgi:hypothetical protein
MPFVTALGAELSALDNSNLFLRLDFVRPEKLPGGYRVDGY